MSTHNQNADNDAACTGNVDITDLTLFRLDVLRSIERLDAPSGLDVKRDLEAYYTTEVHHGRLYPALEQLVNTGLVEKGERDGRTNEYELAEDGKHMLLCRRWWMEPVDGDGGEGA